MQHPNNDQKPFFDALRVITTRAPQIPVTQHQPMQRHECTNACDYVHVEDLYICKLTNNIHVCSSSKCNRLIVLEDSVMCELTHNIYTSDLYVPQDYANAGPMKKRKAAYVCNEPPNTDPGDTPKKKSKITKKTPRAARVAPMATKHRAETAHILKQILEPVRVNTTTSLYELVDCEALTETCEQLWAKCVETEQFQSHPFGYKHDYHVLVVLYHATKGMRCDYGEHVIVTANPVLHDNLPSLKVLLRSHLKDRFKVAVYTRTCKAFLACMRQVYPGQFQ